jgi:L-malate glycosyltransferase
MPAPLRLLHLFPSFEVGGSQMRTTRLIDGLGADFEHSLLSLSGNLAARELLADPERLRVLPSPPKAGSAQTALALARSLRRERPDLLLTYNFGSLDGLIAARLLGQAAVHHEDGFGPDEAQQRKRRRTLMRRALLPTARAVVVPSRLLEAIARREWGLKEPRLTYLPNGIDLERFAPQGPRADPRPLGLDPARPVIVALGSLRREKNLPRLIAALERLPAELGAQLLIVGDGAERASLEARVASSPARARIAFAGAQREPSAWLRSAQILALSSDTEQMPLSLVEAMACGLPAAATDVGDVRSMLPPEQAPFLVALSAANAHPDGAVIPLAAALTALLEHPARAQQIGQANRRLALERYSITGMLARYRALFERHGRGPR